MKAVQIIGGAVLIGGLLWWTMGTKKQKKTPSIPVLPPKNSQYPIPAETNQYPDPPASQSSSLPPISSACSVDTPDEYNAVAKVMGLPMFTGVLPTNMPDDPQTQMFNQLVSGLKTMGGCFAPPSGTDTSTALPSDLAKQTSY
jgi:hypothetical protein